MTPPRPEKVALFTTCLADFAAPGPALAAVEVLEAMGMEVEVPPRQSCCGQPALNSGYPAAAKPVIDQTLAAFDGYDAIVSPAGSCTGMLVKHAKDATEITEAKQRVLDRMWEFTQFVTTYGADLELVLDAKVTYHDSCHMSRFLGERTSPRLLLSRIKGITLIEMTDSDTCCGFGGTFSVKYPELSVAMADVKLSYELEAGAHYVVGSDPGCLMHQQARAIETGVPLKFRHIAELTRDALHNARRLAGASS
jgi:L-lactate dehydrogenase complex protein LldE